MTEEQKLNAFQGIETRFNEAIITNNIQEIKKCISEEWVLVDARVGIVAGAFFLEQVEKGILQHDSMSSQALRVKIYDHVAVVTSRGSNTGSYEKQAIQADEWITNVYLKMQDQWRCVLTHLSPVAASV